MAAEQTLTRFRVDGMDCAACATKIDTAVRRLPGVSDVAVSVTAGTMTVNHGAEADVAAIERQVTALGYDIGVRDGPAAANGDDEARIGHREAGDHRHENGGDHGHAQAPGDTAKPWWLRRNARLTLVSAVAWLVAFVLTQAVPAVGPWAFAAAALLGVVPIARRAVAGGLAGTPFSIETLMTIAVLGAVLIGAAEEGATVVVLFLIGEGLEGVAGGRARRSIQSLAALVPRTALVEENGVTREIAAEWLAVGATILVRAGERIAADGVIVSGESAIDESPVTGESLPVRKEEGQPVFAGTVNGDGALRVRVTAAANDNTIARVVRLVEEAQEGKAPVERFVDGFARWYTPGVFAVAVLAAIVPPLGFGGVWHDWIYKGLALLLIGCPCALVISVPAAIASALSAGARRGLLMKGGAVLERAGKTSAVAFDKTGTLTEGRPSVTDVVGFGLPEAEILRLSAALESGSTHPLGIAILARGAADGIEAPPAKAATSLGGAGISAEVEGRAVFLGSARAAGERQSLTEEQLARLATLNEAGKTVSVLVVEGVVGGAIAFRDEPRADARAGLRALADGGIKTLMLTGDNSRVAAATGARLGIEVRAELLPEDKQAAVRALQDAGYVVAKVGDGINDAPALAAADIGIAMGGGTDVALETADAAILHGRVGDVAAMIGLSRRTMRIIRQNVAVALGLKAVFLVTTVVGVTGLWPAILADTGATVLVTANAMRLLAWRPGQLR